MVRHVIKVDGHGLLFEEFDAFYAYLQVFRDRFLILGLGNYLGAVDAASLVWFVDLRSHDLFKADWLF